MEIGGGAFGRCLGHTPPWMSLTSLQQILQRAHGRKGEHFQGSRVDSCLTLLSNRNELSEETQVLAKQNTLLGRGVRAESWRVRETRRTAHSLIVMALVSRLSLANHLAWPIFGPTLSPSCWCVHFSAKIVSSAKDSGRLAGHIMGWCLLPPFGPSQILLVSVRSSTGFLLFWDNLRRRLSSCQSKAGGFGQRFPNTSTLWSHREKAQAVNQEEGLHQKKTTMAPWSWTFQPQELWEINLCCLLAT